MHLRHEFNFLTIKSAKISIFHNEQSIILFAVNRIVTHVPIPLLKILRVNDPQVLVSLTKSKNPVKRKKAVQTLGTIHHWPGIYLIPKKKIFIHMS